MFSLAILLFGISYIMLTDLFLARLAPLLLSWRVSGLSAFFLKKMGNVPHNQTLLPLRVAHTSVRWVNLGPKGSVITFQDQRRFGRMCNREQMLHLDICPGASLCWPTVPVYLSWTHTSWHLSRCQTFV